MRIKNLNEGDVMKVFHKKNYTLKHTKMFITVIKCQERYEVKNASKIIMCVSYTL